MEGSIYHVRVGRNSHRDQKGFPSIYLVPQTILINHKKEGFSSMGKKDTRNERKGEKCRNTKGKKELLI